MKIEDLTPWERRVLEVVGQCGRGGFDVSVAPLTCPILELRGWLQISRVPGKPDFAYLTPEAKRVTIRTQAPQEPPEGVNAASPRRARGSEAAKRPLGSEGSGQGAEVG